MRKITLPVPAIAVALVMAGSYLSAAEDSGKPDDSYLDLPLPGHSQLEATPVSFRTMIANADAALADVRAAIADPQCMLPFEAHAASCSPGSFFLVAQLMHLRSELDRESPESALARRLRDAEPEVDLQAWHQARQRSQAEFLAAKAGLDLSRRHATALDALPVLTGMFDLSKAAGKISWVRPLTYVEYAGRSPDSGVPRKDYVTAYAWLATAYMRDAVEAHPGRRFPQDLEILVGGREWERALEVRDAMDTLLHGQVERAPVEALLALKDFHYSRMPDRWAPSLEEQIRRNNTLAAARYHLAAEGAESKPPTVLFRGLRPRRQ
ncbi:MAG: hypothetical protein OXM01_10690 [Gemmatimonadota bacterium]|nr:hypothetical protein [Gemmatimonadota bacterium]